jgi:tRNA threonylcarbamoyl adenosine modification protein (Sua5/YciO/YrdC/YwlC family)
MIQYVIPENCDDRILNFAVEQLTKGEVIIIPSDTNWLLVGDIRQKKTIEKLYRLKNQDKKKHFSLLCSSLKMANEVAIISSSVFKTMKRKMPGHYTFILPAQKLTTKYLKASKTDHQVGIRILPVKWINQLIEKFDSPLVSTNLDHEILGTNEGDDIYSYLIEETLSHEVSLILDSGDLDFVGASTILNFSEDGQDPLVRQGVGIWP